jgi:pyruvate/2-oxoglutarate dehydrogenase complex dihydrolipoamide acyltransferase (E2) component
MRRSDNVDHADRWMRSGVEVCTRPGLVVSVEADMTGCRELVEEYRGKGIRITYTHLFVQAAALALARHSDLCQMVAGHRRSRPERVNIALSVAGGSFVAPMVLIRDAAAKAITEIAGEVAEGAPKARAEQLREFVKLRRWGWLVPFAFLRRALLRFLLPRTLWARGDVPVLQVTGLADVDALTPMLLLTTGILAAGQVKEKPVVVKGRVLPRLQVTLTCCADHRVWDGRMTARFLNEVKSILEAAGRECPARPAAAGFVRQCQAAGVV